MKRIPSITDIALSRPVTVTMLVISLIGLGLIARYRMPVEFMPKIELPFIGTWIPYPGATPEQVEKEVAIPAEGQFRTIPHLERITTYSDSNGCNVRLMFNWEANMTTATAEVRDRMERLKLELPDEIERLFLQKFSSDSMPILMVTWYREGDLEELSHLARMRIQPRIARIEGVADVQIFSKPPKEVLIEFDQNLLRASGLGMYQVIEQLRTSNFNMSVGELSDGEKRYFVRAIGEFNHPDQLANLVIGEYGLRLKDVADVGYSSRAEEQEYSIDRNPGAFMLVRKEAEANAIDTADAVKAEIARIKEEPQFAGIDTFTFFDQSEVILSAVGGMVDAGKYGGMLALIVLFLFLRRIRPTLIVACAIPTSLVAGIVFMYLFGMTLNLVTITSMIIAIGLLVDNSIVVIENIYRHLELGETPMEAARKGAKEVGMAITAATTTTLVVFIPTFYLDQGEMQTYMQQFAFPVCVSLVASMVIALTVIPLAASRLKPREETFAYKVGQSGLRRLLPRRDFSKPGFFKRHNPYEWMMNRYLGLLRISLKWRAATVLVIGAVAAFTFVGPPADAVNMQQMPTVDTRQVEIEFEFDQNFDLAMATEAVERVHSAIDGMRDELEIKNIWRFVNRDDAELTVYLKAPEDYGPGEEPKYSTEDTLNILWQRLPERIPGVELDFRIPDAGEGQSRSFTLRMRGDDINVLRQNAERFAQLLETLDDVADAETGVEKAEQEMQIQIDESLLDQVGVSPLVIAQTVDFALRGIRLTPLKQGGREVEVWAQFREEDRKSRENLENVGIQSQSGELVPLNQLVDLEKAKSPQAIRRVDGKSVTEITVQTASRDMGGLYNQIRELARNFEMPRGYSIDLGDEINELDKSFANFVTAAMLATILIFIVMGALFESYLLPISILMSIPLSFVGVIWAMALTGTSVDMIAFIGMILMLGLVVNNGIVIVDYINQLRNRGMERSEAVIQAGRDRVRPVLMTAMTTILGCVPLAIEGSVGNEVSFASLGRALIGGLTTGTVLTLYVVPVVYTLVDDLRIWFTQFFADVASVRSDGGSGEDEVFAK